MEGQLSEHPLAELIREVTNAGLSGALRLSHARAQVVVYFEKGDLLFAVSNLRAHRLREVLKRNGIPNEKLNDHPSTSSDDELAASLVKSGAITPAALQESRSAQATDVLRVALLWTDGYWSFDSRVRVAGDLRVPMDVDRLLLECARHLPLSFVKSRVDQSDAAFSVIETSDTIGLSPTEAFMFSRVAEAGDGVRLAHLANNNGLTEEDCLRSVYALSLSGMVNRSNYTPVLGGATVKARRTRPAVIATPTIAATTEADE